MASKVTENACGFCHSDALGKQVCAEYQRGLWNAPPSLPLVFAKILPIKKKKLVIALHGQENSPWQVIYITYSFIYWPHHAACGILVPRPGVEPPPPALGAWSLNHWTLAVIFETSGNREVGNHNNHPHVMLLLLLSHFSRVRLCVAP